MYEARTLAAFAVLQLRNDLRQVARSKLRSSMWVLSSLAAIAFVVLRVMTLRLSRYDASPIVLTAQVAEIYSGAFVLYLALPLLASRGSGAQFANVAEALLIGTSQLHVRSIFILLQLRAVWRLLARSIIVLVILATSGNANPSELTRITVLAFLALLVSPAYAFHLSVASETVRKIARACGVGLVAFAAALAFGKIPHGGAALLALAHGAWWPDALAIAIATYGVCVPPLRDPIPELFAATKLGGIPAQRVANRLKKRERSPDGGNLSEWIFDLQGAWVILSARLAAFIRMRTPLAFAAGLFGWFALGIAIGIARHVYGPSSDEVIGATALPVLMIVCILAATIGRDLSIEIRNPIWWTGDATLTARLGVDSIASMWRFIVSLAAGFIGYAAFGRVGAAILSFVAFTIAVWLARCCGYVLFAYFPAAIDQRGGLAGLRIFVLFALAIPVVSIAVGGLVLQLPVILQFGLDCSTAIAEAIALTWLSARRIDGRLEAYLV